MSNPTTRVLALLELLQSRRRSSGGELARELGVDRRTLRRYIAALEGIGIPITTERGRDGGYSLVAGFKLPPMVFTNEEVLAISLGLQAADRLGAGESAAAVASARAKLERVMPPQLQQRLRALGETVTLDLTPANTADSGLLGALAAAAQGARRVHFHYLAGSGGPGARTLDPYGLVFRHGRWYAVGHCQLRGQLRSFRLDRMQQLVTLAECFERPRNFDAGAYLRESFASMAPGQAVEVLLHTDLAGASAALPGHYGLLTPQGDALLWRTHADCLQWFARELARLPFPFEARAPQDLKQALRELGEELLAAH